MVIFFLNVSFKEVDLALLITAISFFFPLNLSGEIHGITRCGVWAVFALVIWCGLSSSPSRLTLIVWCGKAVKAVCLHCKTTAREL